MFKHLQKFSALMLVCCCLLGSGKAWGQVLTEHFNYAAGSLLKDNGWTAHSGAGTNPVAVTAEGSSLVYRDYAGSGKGNAVSLTTSGEDVHKSFTAYTSGTVYTGFLVNVSAASTGDYFLHLGPSSIGSTFTGRVYVKSSGDGFQFGISKITTPAPIYSETVYEYGKTYLVVMKYTFVEGATNDVVELFINPNMTAAEPATAQVTAATGGTDAVNIGSVALRQGSATSSPVLKLDGLVISNNWSDLRGISPLLIENFSYAPATPLVNSGNWTAHSGAGTNTISTTSAGSSLVYNGYAASGVGEAVILKTSGEDVNRSFEPVTEGNLYAGLLLNASTATATGDYFFHLGTEPLGSNFIGRLFIKSSGTGFVLGISKGSTPAAVYSETVYEFGRTYLVVVKYDFEEGATNDNVMLYVNPVISAGEPAAATVTAAVGGTDPANLGTVALRQGSSSNAANLVVDGIVIGTDWKVLEGVADVIAPTILALTPANGATSVKTTTQSISITFSENVVKGTGTIVLADAANPANNQNINVTSAGVSVNGATVTIPVTLAPNTSYSVQIPATAFTDRSGNAFAGISNTTTWAFTTPQFATPVLSANTAVVRVPYTPQGTTAQATSYMLSGVDVRETVTVTATGGFEVSLDGITFAPTVAVPAATPLAATIYVKLNATAVNDYSGTITHSTPGADNLVLTVTGGVYNPFAQDFNNCTPVGSTALTGGWMQYSVTGAQTWGCTTFGRETATGTATNGVQINGFSGSALANEDWLISPAFDLSGFSAIPLLSVWTRSAFSGPGLKLMISTNYDGMSAPSTATWTELNANFPESGSDVWTKSEVLLDAYKQHSNAHVAFVYTSLAEANGASRWTLDDFMITNEAQKLITSDTSIDFGAIAAGQTTAGRTFTLRALGFSDNLVVTVPANFQISKNNADYAQSVTYTAAEAATEQTVYVRFAPQTTALAFSGNVMFTAGSFSMTGGRLTGSSIPKSSTLDVVTWNVEWFGADRDGSGVILGPSDDQLQYQNVKQAILALDADIYALQEIANDQLMAQLVSELPGYSFVKSDVHSYSIRQSTSPLTAQKLYYVYKNETVTFRNQKVLLLDLYRKLITNDVVLPAYPGGSGTDAEKDDSFWASGRLPYMAAFDVTIGGVTKRVNLLNIHARANSGTNTTVYFQRKYDLEVLKDTLDAHYSNLDLIMLGDYNDDVDVSVVGTNPSTYAPFVTDPKYKVLTYDLSLATTQGTYQRSSFLDHITISASLTDEYISNSVRIEEGLYSLIPRYHTTTSDHGPVSARFILNNSTTSLPDLAAKGGFSVYPNPVQGTVQLVLPEHVAAQSQLTLSVWSTTGAKLFEVNGTQAQVQQSLNSRVASLPKGLFIMKVVSGNDAFQTRVVKN